jgi:choline dehydrogenase
MLSGIREETTLRLGIDVVENLPGVGENLQDHVLLSGVVFKYKGQIPDPIASNFPPWKYERGEQHANTNS